MEEKKSRSQVVTILKVPSRNCMAVGTTYPDHSFIYEVYSHMLLRPMIFAKQNLADAFQHPSPSHIFEQDEFAATSSAVLCTGPEMSLLVGFVSVGIAVIICGALGGNRRLLRQKGG